MQIKRLLDGREVFAGDKLFDAQGRFYTSQAVIDRRSILSEKLREMFFIKPTRGLQRGTNWYVFW